MWVWDSESNNPCQGKNRCLSEERDNVPVSKNQNKMLQELTETEINIELQETLE